MITGARHQQARSQRALTRGIHTSAIHWERVFAMGITDCFHETYLSHRIGHLKPSAEAFRAALEGMRLPPSEIVFLDDSRCNVDAAAKLGLRAHLVRGPDEARRVLAAWGVLRSRDGE